MALRRRSLLFWAIVILLVVVFYLWTRRNPAQAHADGQALWVYAKQIFWGLVHLLGRIITILAHAFGSVF